MMVKNESKRIHVSLESVKNIVEGLIIYDTGSEDNTIEIIDKFAKDNHIPLHLKTGIFENFEKSRNDLLDFADQISEEKDFYFLLDCNDEVQNGDKLLQYVRTQISDEKNTAYFMRQVWFHGLTDDYYNIRLLKAKKGLWRYAGVVHEYLYNTQKGVDFYEDAPRVPDVIIYQDRTKDFDKTFKRFEKDYILLKNEHERNPENRRTTFYLAQTCGCLNKKDEEYKYYKERYDQEGGYLEERYLAALRLGRIKTDTDWGEAMAWNIRALEIYETAEPLTRIAEYYINRKKWNIGGYFIKLACSMPYPEHLHLFKDELLYTYYRYHLFGLAGGWCGEFEEGKKAAIKACAMKRHNLDKESLECYEKREQNIINERMKKLRTNLTDKKKKRKGGNKG